MLESLIMLPGTDFILTQSVKEGASTVTRPTGTYFDIMAKSKKFMQFNFVVFTRILPYSGSVYRLISEQTER